VNPSKLFLEVETPHHVVSPDDMARNNMSLDGNIPHLCQLAAMCMRFVFLWRGIEITAIALEVFIFSISLLLVWSLRMRLGLKAMVVSAFSVRLL
jgi:hypothetical protein